MGNANMNLIRNSKPLGGKTGFFTNFDTVTDEYGELTITSHKNYATKLIPDSGWALPKCNDYEPGATLTWSYDIMYTQWDVPDNSLIGEWWMGQRYTNGVDNSELRWKSFTLIGLPTTPKLNEWQHITKKVVIPSTFAETYKQASTFQFYYKDSDNAATITLRMKNVKLEYGTEATDWTPFPGDPEDEWGGV